MRYLILLILLLLSKVSYAVPSFEGINSAFATSISYTTHSNSNTVLFFFATNDDNTGGGNITSVEFDGDSFIQLSKTSATDGICYGLEIWYLKNPSAGTSGNVTTTGGIDAAINIVEYSSIDLTSDFSNIVRNIVPGRFPSGLTITTTVDNSIILDSIYQAFSSVGPPDFNTRSLNNRIGIADKSTTSAGQYYCYWNDPQYSTHYLMELPPVIDTPTTTITQTFTTSPTDTITPTSVITQTPSPTPTLTATPTTTPTDSPTRTITATFTQTPGASGLLSPHTGVLGNSQLYTFLLALNSESLITQLDVTMTAGAFSMVPYAGVDPDDPNAIVTTNSSSLTVNFITPVNRDSSSFTFPITFTASALQSGNFVWGAYLNGNTNYTVKLSAFSNYNVAVSTPTNSPTITGTFTNSPTPTNTPTVTGTFTNTPVFTETSTFTTSPTTTITPIVPTATPTFTFSPTITQTFTNSPTVTITQTGTPTTSPTKTASQTFTSTPTRTATGTRTSTPTRTTSQTFTTSPTISTTSTVTQSFTATQVLTATPTFTSSPTASPTMIVPCTTAICIQVITYVTKDKIISRYVMMNLSNKTMNQTNANLLIAQLNYFRSYGITKFEIDLTGFTCIDRASLTSLKTASRGATVTLAVMNPCLQLIKSLGPDVYHIFNTVAQCVTYLTQT